MNVIGVIPARYQSTRLPFKLMKTILGKSLLQWSWENASKASFLDKLIIACDDPVLEEEAKKFGAEVVMTSSQHICGTDRIAEAVRDIDVKIVINIQADEPIVHPSVIDSLIQTMLSDSNLVMVTARKKVDEESEIRNPNVVKVVCDKDHRALYFSRFSLPYYRDRSIPKVCYKHLGIYGYTKDFLYTFKNMPVSYLENAEKLEQLRVLEAGYKVKVIETQFDSWGVDTEEDLQKIEKILEQNSLAKVKKEQE